ncbi:hypothetical protein ABZ642_45430 [Streptomyces sp. NPDC007157]|uniref:hypothetical protein n=1 Tax=Streptomyces sp. NPDC007157 TaxID=3154681 RepID=UPI0033F2FE09
MREIFDVSVRDNNSPALLGGYRGGVRLLTGGGRSGILGTRHRLMGALTSLFDGAGMPVDTGGLLADATAEAGRGLAPVTAAAVLGGMGARLGLRGGYGLLIGRRPDREQLARWRRPTAGGDPAGEGPGPAGQGPGGGEGPGGRGPSGSAGGPGDRFRNELGQILNRNTGQVLHDQNSDRTLLSTRAHNRLVRYRGYRILNRSGRAAYGATWGLPATVRQGRESQSRFTQDARQQLRVWGNTLGEDGRVYPETARHIARTLREHADDRGGAVPFARRLSTPATPAPTGGQASPRSGRSSPLPAPAGTPVAPPPQQPGGPAASGADARQSGTQGPPPRPVPATPRRPIPNDPGPLLPGSHGVRSSTREEAQRRFEDLLRRTAPEAERRRQMRERPPQDGGEEE